jgi:hypothetical protein
MFSGLSNICELGYLDCALSNGKLPALRTNIRLACKKLDKDQRSSLFYPTFIDDEKN